jgi:TonB family protein
MRVTSGRRTRGGPTLVGLLALLLVSLTVAAPAAQDPNQRLLDWAVAGQAGAIRELLSESEEVVVDSTDDTGWTALMMAVNAGHDTVVRLLLDAGASVHLKNDAQDTALHLAARQGRTESARRLLGANADFLARDADGRTPLFLAIAGRRSEIIELLHGAALASSNRQSPTRALVVEGETVAPVVIQWTTAPYTDHALTQGIEGTVALMALVRQDGSVGAVTLSQGLEESLDRSALRAVRTWMFDPARRSGKPVTVVVEINVDFELPEER